MSDTDGVIQVVLVFFSIMAVVGTLKNVYDVYLIFKRKCGWGPQPVEWNQAALDKLAAVQQITEETNSIVVSVMDKNTQLISKTRQDVKALVKEKDKEVTRRRSKRKRKHDLKRLRHELRPLHSPSPVPAGSIPCSHGGSSDHGSSVRRRRRRQVHYASDDVDSDSSYESSEDSSDDSPRRLTSTSLSE